MHARVRHLTAIAAAVLALPLAAAPEAVDETDAGRIQFLSNCAVCHGAEAGGDGPLSSFLKTPPADLRGLSKRAGGEFPFERVYDVIDGRAPVGGHGTRDMPAWGAAWKDVGPSGYSETYVRGRILEIILYLRAIQQP